MIARPYEYNDTEALTPPGEDYAGDPYPVETQFDPATGEMNIHVDVKEPAPPSNNGEPGTNWYILLALLAGLLILGKKN
jgi:hypothetical protein